MNRADAILRLRQMDSKGKYVFTKHELSKIFMADSEKGLTEGLVRLVRAGLLLRACRGVYINPYTQSNQGYTIEHIAIALRRGEYNYLSLESMLSEYGAISQILLDRLTVMTTGRKGVYKTAYGVIEFTHTKRPTAQILAGIKQVSGRPLRIATQQVAWRDLKRVGRNTDMVDLEEIKNAG